MAKAKEEAEPKYGVEELSKKLGITEPSTRAFLRSISAERTRRAYGWDTMAEVDAIAKQYQSRSSKKESKPAKAKMPSKKQKEAA